MAATTQYTNNVMCLPMRRHFKSHFPALRVYHIDEICATGAMKGLISDNAKAQTSTAIKDIFYQYNIDDMQSEPHQQNQNLAERHIQE
eukprot:8272968-Ditylum_brightwellii.AAC.1